MSKLQNDFTTKQQSEKLLALGMPRLSANFYYDDENEVQIVKDLECELQSKGYFPCWSVGRLIELYIKAKGLDFMYFRIMSDADMIDYIVRMFVENQNEMDFSKLEE